GTAAGLVLGTVVAGRGGPREGHRRRHHADVEDTPGPVPVGHQSGDVAAAGRADDEIGDAETEAVAQAPAAGGADLEGAPGVRNRHGAVAAAEAAAAGAHLEVVGRGIGREDGGDGAAVAG